MTIQFRTSSDVDLVDYTGSDEGVVHSARVSVTGGADEELSEGTVKGLINHMMKNKHGSVFEHNVFTFRVHTPIFVAREFMRHRTFCLPASAKITVGTAQHTTSKPLGKIYTDWKLGTPRSDGWDIKLPNTRNLLAQTLNLETGHMERARMVDVYESGIKPILRIELEGGTVLRCTADHRVWTTEGWVRAGDLTDNHAVARVGKTVEGPLLGIPKRLREGIQVWTTEQKRYQVQPVDQCYLCKETFGYEELQLDHEIPVAEDLMRALDITNLKPACVPCHRSKTNMEQPLSRRRVQFLGARYERVVSAVPDGEEMTYDIAMPPPWHNFVADGVVVHNSYNEESARYKAMEPVFYTPPGDRKLCQEGKASAYKLVYGLNPVQNQSLVSEQIRLQSMEAFDSYEVMLENGIAREVARMVLPVNIYTTFYATCNARALMNFLSLRIDSPSNTYDTHPLFEIQSVASHMETLWALAMPVTFEAFTKNGRVAP